jgi:hypothetical protein
MALLTARSSTIFIAVGDETRVYRCIEEIPPALRRRLHETTRSMNSATILIADKGGRAELVRALQGRPSSMQSRLIDAIRAPQPEKAPAQEKRLSFALLRKWLQLLLPAIIGASLLLFIEGRV